MTEQQAMPGLWRREGGEFGAIIGPDGELIVDGRWRNDSRADLEIYSPAAEALILAAPVLLAVAQAALEELQADDGAAHWCRRCMAVWPEHAADCVGYDLIAAIQAAGASVAVPALQCSPAEMERLDAEVVVSRRVMAVMRERLELATSKLRRFTVAEAVDA